jgi:hypothetical protein
MRAVETDDACRFLSPVLQGVKPKRRQGRRIAAIRFPRAEHPEDAAFFMQFVVIRYHGAVFPAPPLFSS